MPYFLLIIGFVLLFYYSKTNNKITEEKQIQKMILMIK